MKKLIFAIFFICSLTFTSEAQSFIFGPKIGPSLSFQRWNSISRDVLFAYNAGIFIESYDEGSKGSLYAELGYHQRGSSERSTFSGNAGGLFQQRQAFRFNNIALKVGARQRLKEVGEANFLPYYIVALRGEYTIGTNLDQYLVYNGYFPVDAFVNKINYGLTVGGGFETKFSEFVGGAIEFSISPDISKQYDQPQIPNVVDPYNPGNLRTLPQQQVRNLSLEISLVLRLLRKVEYY